MSVSRLRGETPTIMNPARGHVVPVHPLWEFEELLATGLALDHALLIMAARRAELMLVDADKPDRRSFQRLAAWRFGLTF